MDKNLQQNIKYNIMKNIKIFLILVLFFSSARCLALAQDSSAVENIDDNVLPSERKLGQEENGEIKKIADDNKGIFSVILENDIFTGHDRGYTNGVRFSYISPEENMPKFVQFISQYIPVFDHKAKRRVGLALGQSIYTPSDITQKNYLPNDFLYAGWLYGSLGLISDSGSSYDNTVLTIGTVGPASGARETQSFVHHVKKGSPHPQGWDNQIKNEPGIIFTYERKWRNLIEVEPFGVGIDAVPHVGVNLGNILTNASIGATFRLGYDLPADYGPPRIRPTLPGSDFFIPTKKLGGYLFVVLEERAVARNIFLDGNTFKDSHSVNKRNFVGSAQFGATITYEDFRISYSYIILGREFKGQKEESKFGAITVSYRF